MQKENPVSKTTTHPDDAAVDIFALSMKNKLALAREKGRRGWQACSEEYLLLLLRDHVEKGDMRDVANLAMMIHMNREALRHAR